jgi:hypothetical protein
MNFRNNRQATPAQTSAQRTVQVRNFFTINDGGALKAFFDVVIPFGSDTLEICRCRLIQQEQQAPWISGPVEAWEEDGKRRFRHLTKFPDRWKTAILDLVLREWETPGGPVIGGQGL